MSGLRMPLNALQKAVYERVTSAMPTVSFYSPVAPSDADLPFIVLSSITCTDMSLKGKGLCEAIWELQVWHQEEESFETINTIIDQLVNAITQEHLHLVDAFQELDCKLLNVNVVPVQNEAGMMQRSIMSFSSRVIDNASSL